MYNKLVLANIEREKAGISYWCGEEDKKLLNSMLSEINEQFGLNLQYLAELDAFYVEGSGEIISHYIHRFMSESVKGYLLYQMVTDNIKDCDKLILELYMGFKSSSEYISAPNIPAPAHIYVRYDNAISRLKPKRLKNTLIQLAHNPRDVVYLPLSMKMLASWKIPEIRDLLIVYSSENNDIKEHDVGIHNSEIKYFPSFAFIKRQLRFSGIQGLKYYPSNEIIDIITGYTFDKDSDIAIAAKKTLKALKRAMKYDTR